MTPADRHRAAVDLLGLRGDERVLDIGCGHGVATALALAAVPDGRVIALDRSPKMADAVRRRLGREIEQGTVEVVTASIADADLAPGRVDAALAVNVIALVDDPSQLDAVVTALAPGGRFALVFEPPSTDQVAAIERAARAAFARAGLEVVASGDDPARVAILGRRAAG
jgi:cyclopropane fatty-acyl-phospholipid synthase-like methyltransferase